MIRSAMDYPYGAHWQDWVMLCCLLVLLPTLWVLYKRTRE